MTTHLFGGVWSPSCANFTLKRTAEEYGGGFDAETIERVDKNFYVDDCLKSVPEEAAIPLVEQLRELLALGGFRLTKWLSNSREVIRTLPEPEKAKSIAEMDLDKDGLPSERALGVLWSVEEDNFTFDTNVKEKPLTKRGLLSVVSSVYDPLGFVSPFVLPAKMIFQSLCRRKLGCDEEMPKEFVDQWNRWLSDLATIAKIKIPRCLKPCSDFKQPISAQLHHFSDASEQGLGAVTYLRLLDNDGKVHCSLLMAKAKLAPLKTTTIPRLELAAAVVSTRLDKCIHEHLEMPLMETVYWTDSMIVLQYLRNEGKRFQTFVANRIAEIRDHSSPLQWRHVDSMSNPADDVSRGVSAGELVDNDHWIQGPAFLYQEESAWPTQPGFNEQKIDCEAEIKKEPRIYQSKQDRLDPIIDNLFTRYSSWYHLKKAVVWILRAKDMLRQRITTHSGKPMSVEELERAETAIISYVQRTAFPSRKHQEKLAKLFPMDADGVLRVGGRLTNAPIPYTTQHQAILPGTHPVTRLIIKHYHVMYGHSGTERILVEIRQKFWIIKGRSNVKRVLGECLDCRKRNAPKEAQLMADLPKVRVTPSEPPFTTVGIDYFGPFCVRRGRSEQKRYGCLFTCLTTRAIHLEVAHTLDTDSFLCCLQRFVARRGEPKEIRSDNGTNFVGGRRELRAAIGEWNQQQIHGLNHMGLQSSSCFPHGRRVGAPDSHGSLPYTRCASPPDSK